ncbi:MAG: hypothetical protein MK226_05450 [Saprospiraceae bacterium]|jgi:hypothetical protein|nr:hypothetical protein [Saprospiraceae bacterium]
MKINFENRLAAVDWIADYAEDEGQFEALRERLNYNYIYYGEYFLELEDETDEIVLFSSPKDI